MVAKTVESWNRRIEEATSLPQLSQIRRELEEKFASHDTDGKAIQMEVLPDLRAKTILKSASLIRRRAKQS
jgi:hypothetical protein